MEVDGGRGGHRIGFEGNESIGFPRPYRSGQDHHSGQIGAFCSLQRNKKITLITVDTYRIGAIEQLKTYARILRLSFEIAYSREELKEVIQNHIHQDLLLIDTAGRNPYQEDGLEELRHLLTVDERLKNHLVLNATTKDADLAQIVRRFSELPIRSYIFSKIDETEEYSSMFNQLARYKRTLSYLSNGQKIPEDIELATKGRVANFVLKQISWN